MLSRVAVRATLRAPGFVRHFSAATDTTANAHPEELVSKTPPITPTPPTLSSKQLEELNELSVALTQRGHTCVNTTASPSALTWCGKGANECSGPGRLVRASIHFPSGLQPRRLDDLSKVLLAFATAPWLGILVGSVIFR